MSNKINYIIVVGIIVISLTACVSEKEKDEMREMLKENISKSSSSTKEPVQSTSSYVEEQEQEQSEQESKNTEKQESESTVIDNKKPSQASEKDGITIHIPQSDIDDILEAAKEFSKAMEEIPVYSYDSNRKDWEYSYEEYSEPTEWREYAESKRDETAGWMNED